MAPCMGEDVFGRYVTTVMMVMMVMMAMMLTLSIGGAISRSEGRWPDLMNWISTWDNRKLGSDHHHQNENDDDSLEWFGHGGVRGEKAEDFHFKSLANSANDLCGQRFSDRSRLTEDISLF